MSVEKLPISFPFIRSLSPVFSIVSRSSTLDPSSLRIRTAFPLAVSATADSPADVGTDPDGVRRVGVPDAMPDWLPPAVTGLAPGQTSEVRRVGAGFSVAHLEQVRPAGPQPFEEVQPAIKDALLQFKRAAARAAYIDELKASARIEYLPAARELMPR